MLQTILGVRLKKAEFQDSMFFFSEHKFYFIIFMVYFTQLFSCNDYMYLCKTCLCPLTGLYCNPCLAINLLLGANDGPVSEHNHSVHNSSHEIDAGKTKKETKFQPCYLTPEMDPKPKYCITFSNIKTNYYSS